MTLPAATRRSRSVWFLPSRSEDQTHADCCLSGVFEEWHVKGTGPLSTNGIEAGVKIRPTEAELKEMESWPTPDFKKGWESYFKNKPDKPVMHYSIIAGWFGDHMLM
jgi:hypothetical protein